MRHQIFGANGLSWNDYDDEVSNSILEELLSTTQEKHDHCGERELHPRMPQLRMYLYIIDHGATTTHRVTDSESILKTADVGKPKQLKAIGLMEEIVQVKQKIYGRRFNRKKMTDVNTRVKAMQMQAVKVATDLAVKAKRDPAFSQHHDLFEYTYQKFNEFAIMVSVGIAQVEEAGGDFHTRNGRGDSYFHECSIC